MKDITPAIWQYFEEICRVPRPSKKEEKICAYIRQFAEKQQLSYKQDSVGNIVICKPASAGMENAKTLILQSHVDMVCEKDAGVKHDFDNDPIDFYTDGDWVKARGTTLGADDGIGIATMLAILADKSLEHGPLEALFTVDEETGLTGANHLGTDMLTGDTLINLDSEDEGELFIGCAGGVDTVATFTYEKKNTPSRCIGYTISIGGMMGGHSGDDIDKRRGNAIKMLNHMLLDASGLFGISISRFEGGNLRNAIPREAKAVVAVHADCANDFMAYCTETIKLHKEILAESAPDYYCEIQQHEAPPTIIDIVTQSCLMHTISLCPSGVVSWSDSVPGFVETSSNLASVKFEGKKHIVIATSQRSDKEKSKLLLAKRVRTIFEMSEAKVVHSDGYPGWTPNPDSALLQMTKSAYTQLFGQEPVVRAIHAGLECGLFLEKYPNLDMISFGPTIRNVHSPSEQLNIPTVKKFSDLLLSVLAGFKA